MLKALRASFRAAKTGNDSQDISSVVVKHKKSRFNNALMLRKDTDDTSTSPPAISPPLSFGIDYRQRIGSVEKNNNIQYSPPVSNDSSTKFGFQRRRDLGFLSLKDKAASLRESLRKTTEHQQQVNAAIPEAKRRFVQAMENIGNLKRKIAIGEERLEKLERQLKPREARILERHTSLSENRSIKERIEREKTDDVRDAQNIKHEMREMYVVRESTLGHLRDVTTKVDQLQTAVQTADKRQVAASRRVRLLEDALDAYKRRIRDLQSRSSNKVTKVEHQHHKLNDLEDAIAECYQRYLMAEKRILPLKICVNQLQDALQKERQQTRQTEYLLANYQQRLKGHRYRNYHYNN